MSYLRLKPGIEKRVCWGKPDSPMRSLCCLCHGALPEVPLMLSKGDGSLVSFCDECAEQVVEKVP